MSFFVPPLIDDPKTKEEREFNDRNWRDRQKFLENLAKQNFQLVYFGHFSYSELDEMPVQERRLLYNFLVEQKDEESKQAKEIAQKNKEAQAQARAKARHHRR